MLQPVGKHSSQMGSWTMIPGAKAGKHMMALVFDSNAQLKFEMRNLCFTWCVGHCFFLHVLLVICMKAMAKRTREEHCKTQQEKKIVKPNKRRTKRHLKKARRLARKPATSCNEIRILRSSFPLFGC